MLRNNNIIYEKNYPGGLETAHFFSFGLDCLRQVVIEIGAKLLSSLTFFKTFLDDFMDNEKA